MPEEERRISPAVLIIPVGLGIAAVVGIAALAMAAPPTPPPGRANLYGKVTDTETGEAIPGVAVSLWDTFTDPATGIVIPGPATTYTDSGGNYAFTDLEPGEYGLEFSKADYQTLVY